MPEIGPNIALHASPSSRNSTVLIFTVPVYSLCICQSSSSIKCFASEQVDGKSVYCVKSVNQTCIYNLINCLGCSTPD